MSQEASSQDTKPAMAAKEKTIGANAQKKNVIPQNKMLFYEEREIRDEIQEMVAFGKIMKMEEILDDTYQWKTYKDVWEEYLVQLDREKYLDARLA